MSGSLDPEDWDEFRALCHAAVDDMVDWWEQVRERPVWRPVPDEVKAALTGTVPRHGADLAEVYRRFRELILPYPTGNTHPRFMGWVHGAGTPAAALAEFLAAALNPNLGGREHAPVYVERQIVDWSRQIMGLPEDTSGLLVGGTSMATVIGLAAARHAQGGAQGPVALGGKRPVEALARQPGRLGDLAHALGAGDGAEHSSDHARTAILERRFQMEDGVLGGFNMVRCVVDMGLDPSHRAVPATSARVLLPVGYRAPVCSCRRLPARRSARRLSSRSTRDSLGQTSTSVR